MLSAKHKVQEMSADDTAINIIDGLKGQHAQLRRLLAQRMWINEASKATLAELENQIAQIKTVLLELEEDIQDQLKRVQ
jgi:gas vesicle protein